MSNTCSPACSGIRAPILWTFLLFGLCSCLRQYIVVQQSKNWLDAQRYCRSTYTDLATMDTVDDVNKMIADGAGFIGKVWIGLYDNESSWMWSTPGGFTPLKFFGPVQPSNPSNPRNLSELCGVQMKDNWSDALCNQTLPFVCYSMGVPPFSTKTYVFINQALTWYEAQAYCRQNYTDLASVMSPPENDAIKKVIPSGTLTFIGLHRLTWTWWSDGSVHTLNHWTRGHPQGGTGDCAASLIDAANVGNFMEYTCDTNFYFMCYKTAVEPPPTKYLSRFTLKALKSTIDLNDPAVTGAILNLFEEKLKQTNTPTNSNVTWIEQPDKEIFYRENN